MIDIEAIVTQKVEEHRSVHTAYYDAVINSNFTLATTVADLMAQQAAVEKDIGALVSRRPQPLDIDLSSTIKEQYTGDIEAYNKQLERLKIRHDESIVALNAEHSHKLKAATEKASAGVQPLIDKHNKLMSYKDAIEGVCSRYGITPTEIQISTDISAEEYSALLDAAISGCESVLKQKNAKFNPIALLYKPMEWENSPMKQVAAITIFAILFHNFGGIIALALFVSMYLSTIGIYKKLDKVRIAESMMYTPDFDKFMQRDEIEAIADVDTSQIDAEYANAVAKLQEADPNAALSKDMQAYTQKLEFISKSVQDEMALVNERFKTAIDVLKNRLSTVQAAKDEAISHMKKFGDSMLQEKPLCYPTYTYTLGMLNDVIEQQVEVPKCSMLFNPSDSEMLNFLKLMLCNALLSVKEKKLSVYIYDPEKLGQDFAEFLSCDKTTHDYITIKNDGLEELLKNLRASMSENIKKCGQRTLDELNKEAEEKQMVTYDYTIVIMMSAPKDFFENTANIELLQTSYNYGLRFWAYSNKHIQGVHLFEKAYDLPDIKRPFKYSYELGAHVTQTFAKAIENSKDGGIDYYHAIQERYIPKEKWGTWSSNKGIELNFGLADGDPSKGYPMVLGDANVHLLMAGQSGAGKSAAINQMLLSLLTKYTPNELELVMIDFKNVEFSTFTVPDPKSDGKLSIIPHAKIMAGTKDGEYALSIFDYLIWEMERRQKVFGAVNQKKLEDYNNLMKEQGHPEKCLPRILLLIDEFQVMFTEVDRPIVDKIQDRIRSLAKLARAFGCHMWFTSQSMSGTMSNDVKANFSMRAALRCTREVSTEIIGNAAAGNIKAKFGYLVTNDSTGQDPTRNTLWRVPFVSTKNILKTMNECAELYRSWGIQGHASEFYDEDQKHKDKELFDFYSENESNPKVQDKHLFVLGERTSFSLNGAPVNFYVNQGDFANIIIGGMEDQDLLNLTRTVMDNAQVHGIKTIISCADEDAHTLLELDTRLQGPYLKWSYPSVDFKDWVDPEISPLQMLINKRKNNPGEAYDPVFVILYNWDKYPGFGVAQVTKPLDTFHELLRIGPTVDVHFILVMKSKGEISTKTYAQFKYKICALSDEMVSLKILDTAKANKLSNKGGFGILKIGNEEQKFKIYQHEFGRKLADKELTL